MRRKIPLPRRATEPGPERSRMLRDIHDGLGPILTGMAFGLRAARNLIRQDPESAARLLAQLEEEVHGAIAEVRRLTDEIRPTALDRLDLAEAIRLHAMTLSSRMVGARCGELRIDLHTCGDLDSLAPPVRVAVYRIICEALTNAARHSGAQSCFVSIRLDEDLRVEVVDDGIGLSADETHPWAGVGLHSMRARAAELGGVWEIAPCVSGGTRVAATFPVRGS